MVHHREDGERARDRKQNAFLIKTLIEYIKEKRGVPHKEAARCVDADYTRGYVMYVVAENESTCETTKIVTKHNKSQLRIFDSKDGVTYWTTDIARDFPPLEDFKWDHTLSHVNELGVEHA